MKLKRFFIYGVFVLAMISCESGFNDVIKETRTPRDYKYFAYVANNYVDKISAFAIDEISGALTLIDTYSTGDAPSSVASDPEGKFLYAACSGEGNLDGSVWAIRRCTDAGRHALAHADG